MAIFSKFFVLVGIFAVCLDWPCEARPTKIHLFAAVDSFDPKVGAGCKVSWERLEKFLLEQRPDKEHLSIFRIPERVPSRTDALHYYETEPFEPNDVIWFYYCGHGITDDTFGHVLKMDGGGLPRKELRAAMEARKVQGVLLTTDACAVDGRYDWKDNGERYIRVTAREEDPRRPWRLIASLIGNLHGTVDITASTGRRPAFVDLENNANEDRLQGALFTNALVSMLYSEQKTLDLDNNGIVDWNEAFASLREGTRARFRGFRAQYTLSEGKEPEASDQIPFAFSLGKLPLISTSPENAIVVPYVDRDYIYHFGDRYLVRAKFDKSLVNHRIFMGVYFLDENDRAIRATNEKFSITEHKVIGVARVTKLTEELLDATDNQPLEFDLPDEAFTIGNVKQYVIFFHDMESKKMVFQKPYKLMQ